MSRLRKALLLLPGLVLLGGASAELPKSAKQGSKPADDAKQFAERARPFFAKHCQECHGGKKVKGNFRLSELSSDFGDDATRERWLTVLRRLKAGEMPPKSQPRPPQKEVRTLTDWITTSVAAADAVRRTKEGRVVLRRLNRVEYQNTVRDLLGVDVDLHEMLPVDESAHGFDNVGEALHVSSFLMERYLEAADKALSVAIANGAQPTKIKKRYSLKDTHQLKTSTERVYRKLDDGTVVCFSSSHWNTVVLTPFYPPDRGRYRFRISVSAVQSSSKPVTFRVDAGPMLMGTKNHLVSYFDAPADKATVVEFTDHLEARSHISILPYGLERAQTVDKIGADKYKGPGLAVHWVEAEGPLHDTWPPQTHRRLFGDLPQAPSPSDRNRLEVVSKNPEADAERILKDFARRAFRRTVTDEDVKPFLDLAKRKLAAKYSFERAVRVGLTAVMVSPHFLLLQERAGKLNDFALASRLSYFLWSTMPDEDLLTLAEQKKLGEADTLRGQVERILKDPKASALIENFVGQW